MVFLSCLVCLLVNGSMATTADSTSDIQTSVHALGAIQAGEIVHGWDVGSRNIGAPTVSHVWQQRLYMQLTLNAVVKQRARIVVSGELNMDCSWTKQQEEYESEVPRYEFYPNDVEGSYAFLGDPVNPTLALTAGYFPFKYNQDVRNLGEYLYRTGTYPGYMINKFDYPLNRLLGLKLSSTLFSCLHQDLMLTTETFITPLQDWGLSYLVSFNSANKIVDIGAGIFMSHQFSVNTNFTTPRLPNNLMPIDSLHTDTSYYTFKGTKLMFRFAFDPKPLISTDIFGKNDLRLYGEAAIIGLKNYRGYYDSLWQRIPVMIGFNIPAFKVFDVLAIEMEWYGSPWPNSYYNVFRLNNLPLPVDTLKQAETRDGGIDYTRDNWKWSVYARRELAGCFSITAQVANDHVRLLRFRPNYDGCEEALRAPGNWWYILKLGFFF
jgi:hypothetical protein